MLKDNGYDVARWDPTTPMPEDMDLLVIDAPLNDFPENLINQIYEYLENDGKYGKNLVYLANSAQKETPNINTFLGEWGLSLRQGSIIGETNPQNLVTAQSSYWFQTKLTTNDDNKIYSEGSSNTNLPIVAFAPTPIDILFKNRGIVNTIDLLDTSSTAFVDASVLGGGTTDPATAEQGTYPLMVLSYKYAFNEDNQMIRSNVLVIGSSEMLDSAITSSTSYGNGEYFISAVNVMTGKTSGIIVTAKSDDTGTFPMTQELYNTLYIIFVMLLPITVIVIGAIVLLRRRHK
jgi:hypothetical protein